MKRRYLFLIIFWIMTGCNLASDNTQSPTIFIHTQGDTVSTAEHPDNEANNWLNELITDYIKHSNNELIKSNFQDSAVEEVWIDQGTNERNGSTYYMYQIGHDMAEDDGSAPRFATDGWVYIDSTRKILYEYDLPNDSLILWKH